MKCLSVAQPWAWAILSGLVDTEYRCYPTDHRGDVLLHAAAGGGPWERAQLIELGPRAPAWEDLPFGRAVGLVELWACERKASGAWAWRLRNPRPLVRPFLLTPGKRLFEVSRRRFRVRTDPPGDRPPEAE